MIINRETASYFLANLANSGFFEEGIADTLQEISNCIEMENKGYHIWNSKDSTMESLIAKVLKKNSKLSNEEKVYLGNYSYKPSLYEFYGDLNDRKE